MSNWDALNHARVARASKRALIPSEEATLRRWRRAMGNRVPGRVDIELRFTAGKMRVRLEKVLPSATMKGLLTGKGRPVTRRKPVELVTLIGVGGQRGAYQRALETGAWA